MRLRPAESEAIVKAFTPFLNACKAELRLFGSRVDDSKKGGDIDLLLIVGSAQLRDSLKARRVQILARLWENVGEQKIDLSITDEASIEQDPFLSLAYEQSLLLHTWT